MVLLYIGECRQCRRTSHELGRDLICPRCKADPTRRPGTNWLIVLVFVLIAIVSYLMIGCSSTPKPFPPWHGESQTAYWYREDGRNAYYPGCGAKYRRFGYTEAESSIIQSK